MRERRPAGVTLDPARHVMAVRPYPERLLHRMSELCAAAGFPVASDPLVPAGTPDADAIVTIRSHSARMLLMPFHGHRGPAGEILDGVKLLHALHATDASFPWRVVMPVRSTGAAAFHLAFATLPADVQAATLVVENPAAITPTTLERHLR